MKKLFWIHCFIIISSSKLIAQSLPPVAQALYNAAFLHDSMQVQFAANHNAQVLATPDGNSFYVQWFPAGSTPDASPLIVTLHGSNGYAFNEFYNWYAQAELHNCGIIALQWYRGIGTNPPNDYFTDTTIYSYIDSALTSLRYPTGKAFLHGFSRGAARSYAIIFNDSHSGKNYFCTTLSNSGSADNSYPLYFQINSGIYGSNVFAGKQWALFCGGLDINATQSGCIGMNNTQTWLQSQGAAVGMFIQDSTLGHNGFHLIPSYIDSVLDYYLTCFNNTLSVDEKINFSSLDVFPNPFTNVLEVYNLEFPVELKVFDIFGREIFSRSIATTNCKLKTQNWNSGVYFLKAASTVKKIIKQ